MNIRKLDKKIKNSKKKEPTLKEKKLINKIRDRLGWIIGFER